MDLARFASPAWLGVLLCGCTLAHGALAGEQTAPPAAQGEQYECVVEPHVVIDVGSAAAGVIETLDVERGQTVSAGEILGQLETGVERAALAIAQARAGIETDVATRQVALDFQRRSRTRVDELFRQKTVAASSMDEAERDVLLSELALRKAREERELATLELERARQVLHRRTIRSPVSGVVMERFVSAGEYVEDQPVLRVAGLDPLRVQVVLPAERYGAVRAGTAADVTPEMAALGVKEAVVVSVDRVLDAASGTFRVELDLPNPGDALPAGMRCTITFADRAPSRETVAALARAKDAATAAAGHGARVESGPRADPGARPDGTPDARTGARVNAARATVGPRAPAPTAAAETAERATPAAPRHATHARPQPRRAVPATASAAIDSRASQDSRAPRKDDRPPTRPAEIAAVSGRVDEGACRRVGPFTSAREARAFAARLDTDVNPKATHSSTSSEVVGYLVLADPERRGTTAPALVAELRARGVNDLAALSRGLHAGQVSLGYYTNATLARERATEITKLGVETIVATRERTRETFWLEVATRPGQGAPAAPDTVKGMRVTACPDLIASRT